MVKSFFYFMSLKTGAAIMGATNLIFSITATVASSVALYHHQTSEDELYLILTLILGIYNIFVAGVIIAALVKGCEKYVFLYIILEMTNLFIISVFAAINVFEYKSFSLAALFVVCEEKLYFKCHYKMNITLRHYCFLVGFLHMLLIVLRLYEKIWQLIVLEEPVLIHDHVFLITSYVIQTISVSLLLYGTATENRKFTLPWLLLATPTFCIVTLYGLFAIFKEERTQILYNFLTIGAIWTMWYVVVQFYRGKGEVYGKIKYIKLISK